MKVAIVGAGVSGLGCAYELIRHGIIPTIYERKDFIGEGAEQLPAICFHIFNIPVRNPLKFIHKNYQLDIRPAFYLKELVMKSQNVKRVVKGNLGYIFTRDNSEDSLLTQLKNVVKVPILFRNTVEVEEIRLDYDYVVVATGNPDVPKKMNTFASTFRSYARVARIGGQFKTDSVSLWLNTEYAKTGFAYLVPCTDNDARLALVVNNILGGEIDKYWGKFLDAEKLTNNVGSFTDIKHELGIITPVQLGNVLFVGNAGGFIDSVVGFGSLNALLSGLLAAKSIIDNHDFNEVSRDMRKDIREKDEFRKAIDTYTNANFDNLVSAVAFPGIKQLIYRNPVFRITNTTFLAKAYNRKVRK